MILIYIRATSSKKSAFEHAEGLCFQHLPRDVANVNTRKTMFDPYISFAIDRSKAVLLQLFSAFLRSFIFRGSVALYCHYSRAKRKCALAHAQDAQIQF